MIVVLESGASVEDVAAVLARMQRLGLGGNVLELGPRRLVHVTRGRTRRARHLLAAPVVRAIVPTSGPRVRRLGRRFYPYHALCASAVALVLLGLLVALAGLFPPGVSDALVPGEPAPAPDWPWYLAPARGLLALAPAEPRWVGPSLLVACALLVLAVPALDRTRGEPGGARAAALVVGGLVLVAVIALALVGGGA